MAWTAAKLPDQSGAVAVVTGANGGLGLEVARELARKGGHVVMAARDQAKAEAAVASIRDQVPGASLELQPLDLASQASVREAAKRILAGHGRIDILVNNAGLMGIPERRTEDGFEMQLAVNHLGHFTLTALLLPALLAGDGARVVSVTSTGRHAGRPLDPANPHLAGDYEPWRAYGAVEAGQRALRPGARPPLPGRRDAGREHRRPPGVHQHRPAGAQRPRDRRRPQPALLPRRRAAVRHDPGPGRPPLLRAATDPGAVGGALYTPRWVNWGPPVRRPLLRRTRNRDAMTTLWRVSERETGITFDVPPG
jgi:short chain dehydrogenase